MKITISIEDENGDTYIEETVEKNLPHIKEIDKQGFPKSFDQLETAVLEARKEITEKTVQQYLEEISKKKTECEIINYPTGQPTSSVNPCIIECELGSLQIPTYEIMDFRAGKRLFTVAGDYFERSDPNEKIVSARFKELMDTWSCGTPSYRQVTEALNRFRLESEGVKLTWLKDNVEKDGKEINAALHKQAEFVLEANGFDKEGYLTPGSVIDTVIEPEKSEEDVKTCKEKIIEAAAKLELKAPIKISDYEDPETAVNISADDVLTDRQASTRPNSIEKGQRKYVTNTVIHVEQKKDEYLICDPSIKGAFAILMGFLAANGLIGMPLYVFYIDGASDLRVRIESLFAPFNYKIILDWFHLTEKLEQRLSSGMKNYKLRHIFEDEIIKPLLWYGNVAGAIASLKNIPTGDIRSEESITKLIDYLTRNEKYIPCYAMRHELGLRNSSNRVEKSNDLIVSSRQKNRGMSWSYEGSRGLASVTAAWKNDELNTWCMDKKVRFSFPIKEAV